jgi:hypothetical protein
MCDHLRKWEEEQMGGTPEGVPLLHHEQTERVFRAVE